MLKAGFRPTPPCAMIPREQVKSQMWGAVLEHVLGGGGGNIVGHSIWGSLCGIK